MKKVALTIALMTLVFCGTAAAQDRDLGIGIIVGEPTGISAKYWLGGTTAVDAAAAWSFSKNSAFHIHADYLFHDFELLNPRQVLGTEKGQLPVYYGIGGRLKLRSENQFGLRFVAGIEYIFEESPLDIFAEVAPILDLAPSTKLSLNAAIGIRYFFSPGQKLQSPAK